MKPTSEQAAIVRAALETKDNLLIEALAGSGKTSTLVLLAEAMPEAEMLCLAFNKRIADEMKVKLPENCEPKTLHSLGLNIWREALGKWPKIDKSKAYRILTSAIDDLEAEEQEWCRDNFSDLLRITSQAKNMGFIPGGAAGKHKGGLCLAAEFIHSIDLRLPTWAVEFIFSLLRTHIEESLEGNIDFDDMIYMPTLWRAVFPRYPLTLVDEAQDLSELNHEFLRKLVGPKRLIAVGDPAQAIYGFRGAHESSMEEMRHAFSMRTLHLSVSFRCPQAIVDHVLWRAPHMTAAKPGGEVRTLEEWTLEDLPETAFIICRNNAPLFNMAVRLLRNGRAARIRGGQDIAGALIKVLRRFGKAKTPRTTVLQRIDAWEKKEAAKRRDTAAVHDKAECLRLFAQNGETLGDAIFYAEKIVNSSGNLELMTGHKSKGLESEDVFFLDHELVRDEGQDRNLRYVISTRALSRLTYIESKDFITCAS